MDVPPQLTLFASLLLSNQLQWNYHLSSWLIASLVEYNSDANSKLYLSGVFYFVVCSSKK